MEVNQIYEIVNTMTDEVLGQSGLVNEDLSNIVDIGTSVINANAIDGYVKSLVNQVGKMVFVDRAYKGGAPSVLMDAWEFGSVCEKIQTEIPDASENESWELEDGTSYDPNVFYKPTVTAKFFNSKVTFEVDRSITDIQVKQSFQNATQLNAFITMLFNAVEKSMTVKTDALVMRTINNFIGETVHDNNSNRVVKLVTKYNTQFGLEGQYALTEAACWTDKEFIRYACLQMLLTASRMGKLSTLFNIGGKPRFTPDDKLHFILLDEFAKSANVYLQSDTFHDEYTKLPSAESVPYWQGSGTDYAVNKTSKIDVKTASGDTVQTTGVIGVMFDREALGVTNYNRRTTTQYNGKGEFTNYFFKMDASYFNDPDENFVVFLAK